MLDFLKHYGLPIHISTSGPGIDEIIVLFEKEFNDIMLEDGYTNLFDFPKFKEFIKIITSDTN